MSIRPKYCYAAALGLSAFIALTVASLHSAPAQPAGDNECRVELAATKESVSVDRQLRADLEKQIEDVEGKLKACQAAPPPPTTTSTPTPPPPGGSGDPAQLRRLKGSIDALGASLDAFDRAANSLGRSTR